MNAVTPVVFVRNEIVFANSRDVAAYFEKEHLHVLRDIDNLLKTLAIQNWIADMFVEQRTFHEGRC